MRTRIVLISVTSAVALAACHSAVQPAPTPPGAVVTAAQAVATGLSDKQVTEAVLGDRAHAQADLDDIVARTGWVQPIVTVQSAAAHGDQADATLHVTWPTGEQPYSYTTPLHLRFTDNSWHWTWDPHTIHPDADATHALQIRRTVPERGRILGAGDLPLVAARPVVRVGIDKAACPAGQVADSARKLARQAGLDEESYVATASSAGPQAFVVAVTYRDRAPFDVTALPCGKAVEGSQMLAPSKDFARQLLGTVGDTTKELIDASHGALRPGDQTGLSGLQYQYNALLAGRTGWTVNLINRADASVDKTLFDAAAIAGQDLRTTLRLDVQQKADDALAARGGVGAVVVIQPSTGKILALATSASNENLAGAGHYPPGSTFKVITALAFLRAGNSPTTHVDCPATLTVDGRTIHNYPGYPERENGSIPLERALAFSCNTAFINTSSAYSDEQLAQAAQALGFGQRLDLGFPAFLGTLQPAGDSRIAKAEQSFGQGTTLASPLATTAMTASVAAGHVVVPTLIEGHTATVNPARPLTAGEAAQLRQMMHVTISDAGASMLQGVLDGAKTGTAEFDRDGELQTHVSLTGFTTNDLAITAFGDTGTYGTSLAPVITAVLS